jgi:hypothetical protein
MKVNTELANENAKKILNILDNSSSSMGEDIVSCSDVLAEILLELNYSSIKDGSHYIFIDAWIEAYILYLKIFFDDIKNRDEKNETK